MGLGAAFGCAGFGRTFGRAFVRIMLGQIMLAPVKTCSCALLPNPSGFSIAAPIAADLAKIRRNFRCFDNGAFLLLRVSALFCEVLVFMQIMVRDNNVDQALRALKKKLQREGVYREMKLRRHYEKPSEKRAREKAAAVRRARKLDRKRIEREG